MHLTIIAKAPVAGRVKTRLCPPCSPVQAAELAAAALLDTIDASDALPRDDDVERILLLDGEPPAWLPNGWRVVPQSTGDLGERLAAGFARLGPGIVVGMETPAAIPALAQGFDALRRGSDVLGPALDGGYWAIGLAATDGDRPAAAFAGVEMSTDRTGAQQLERLRALGRPVELLPEARDIDTFDDVIALAAAGGTPARSVPMARRLVRVFA
jgi:glycosyltransferase A (GT-A) superfamily protein (DUF2064 family)